MSTEYFLIEDKCECCGRGNEISIGKSSMGWVFKLNSDKYKSLEEWIPALLNGSIKDEYEKEISFKFLMRTIAYRDFGERGLKIAEVDKTETIVYRGNTWRMVNDN